MHIRAGSHVGKSHPHQIAFHLGAGQLHIRPSLRRLAAQPRMAYRYSALQRRLFIDTGISIVGPELRQLHLTRPTLKAAMEKDRESPCTI